MPGGLLNILCYGCNDLYLTGAPQITFFKTAYRRYTNFAIESVEVKPNTNTNFGQEVSFLIDRNGDLISKTYLKIDLPQTNFTFNEFQFNRPAIVYTNPQAQTNYQYVTEFMKYNVAAYRSIIRNKNVIGISTFDIRDDINVLFNVQGQTALNNYNSLYNTSLSTLVKYYLKTSNIYDQLQQYFIVDTSDINVISTIMNIAESSIQSSIKVQKYYYDLYKQYIDEYNDYSNPNMKFSWNKNLGHTMIEYIDVYIGGEFVDRAEGEFLDVWTNLSIYETLYPTYNKLIGEVPELITFDRTTKPKFTILLPMQFWFCRNLGSAFPLVASQHNDFIIKVKFRDLNSCGTIENIAGYNYTLDDLWDSKLYNLNVSLFVDYVYLDGLERRKFAQSAHEYLIETTQVFYDTVTSTNYSVHLDFSHPCKEVIFFFQKEAYRIDITGKNNNDYINYTIDSSSTIGPLINAELLINGDTKVLPNIGTYQYYNIIQPMQIHKRTPKTGLYNLGFCLNAEEIQPSGSLNLSRLKDFLFLYNLRSDAFFYYLSDIDPTIEPGSINDEQLPTNLIFKFYARCYNILRISNGYAGLAFSAS
jgi:hypothetical protein